MGTERIILLAIEDITERKNAEFRLQEKTLQLKSLTASLEQRVEDEVRLHLKGEQNLIQQSKLAAIADIFEALTAADRPYSSPMSVSEALTIMHSMCRRGEIDPDLFFLFEHITIIEHYGQRYLRPEQRRDDQANALPIERMT